MKDLKNILTIDVEDWYHTNDFNFPASQYHTYEDRIVENTIALLELLSKYKAKATFFVLGIVAKSHPGLVRSIKNGGHEIGSHGYCHTLVYNQEPKEFRQELVLTKRILEDITGSPVNLYRAPSWSISRTSLWALEILEEEGFICDSSVHPFENPLYGIEGAPYEPYYPIIKGKTLSILEYPPTIFKIGKYCLPYTGGLYLRMIPKTIILKTITRMNKKAPVMVYSHPWELDTTQPRLKVSPLIKFVHYYNLHKTEKKLEGILSSFQFIPLGEAIKEGSYPNLPL